MPETNLVATIEDGLAAIPLLDIHTHLDASHLAARGLHDILLYHMVISDLVSAGCPSSARLPDGQASMTRATPKDHSPPMPRAAMNRKMPRCHGSCAKKQRPVKIE